MASGHDHVLDLLYGRWRTQTMHAGVELGIFEAVVRTPLQADEVARRLELDPGLTFRLLRALATLGLLRQLEGRSFTVTEAGACLHSAHPRSLRDVVLLREGAEHTAIWKHLRGIVRDGRQNGFVREYGSTAFDYARREPAYGRAFDAGMSSHSRLQTEWTLDALGGFDFNAIEHLCDVGGGQGHLLCHLLAVHPRLRGTVFDQQRVIDDVDARWSDRLGVGDRCNYLAGDMFVGVPAADAYIMKMILHDWNDDECVRILGVLRGRACAGDRVFIVEHVIPEAGTPDFAALFDMHMMCWGTGRERTEREYQELLAVAGWNVGASRFAPNGTIGVIEGVA